MKKKQNKCFDDYLVMSRFDLILYLIILIILIIAFIIIYVLYDKIAAVTFIIFIVIHIYSTFGKVLAYINNLRINQYLINHELKIKLGNIIYWNEKNYFLTDNYIIITNGVKIDYFSYQDIKQIHKVTKIDVINLTELKDYLDIELVNGKHYEILIWANNITIEDFKDISEILLAKNPNIKLLEDQK